MRLSRLILLPTALALAAILPASPVLAATQTAQTSSFAGYAAGSLTNNYVIGAKATFTVPKIGTGCSGSNGVIGAFVGAPSSPTAPYVGATVRIGALGVKAVAGYGGKSPWVAELPITIRPGDRVQVRVAVARATSKASFYWENYTTGARYSTTKLIPLASTYDGQFAAIGVIRDTSAKLPAFGTVSIAGANVQLGSDGSWKTLGSRPRILRASMYQSSTALAATGALNTTTLNSFGVTWKACGTGM